MNKKRLEEIKNKLVELRSEIDACDNAELIKEKGVEISALETEREEIITDAETKLEEEVEARAKAIAKSQVDDAKNKELEAREKVILGSYGVKKQDQRKENGKMTEEIRKNLENKAEELRAGKTIVLSEEEVRAITVGSSSLTLVEHVDKNLDTVPFSEVSELVDSTDVTVLNGGESYKKSFTKTYGEGGYTAEGVAYTESEPTFDVVEINKAKITAYTEITEEVTKLPAVDYVTEVNKNIRISIRKKLGKQMIIGAGTSETICGVYNAPVNVMPADKNISITSIDADTLDKIVLGYGGDEAVEGEATLILNKLDLADFNTVRFTDGKRAYKIEGNGGKGYITSEGSFKVPYVINSSVRPFKNATDGQDTMVYGKLKGYKLTQFAPIEISMSKDFKFNTGQIAFRASTFTGGNVGAYRTFIKIVKAEANPSV